jgi:bifunctional non-homologous end joining protein LigD
VCRPNGKPDFDQLHSPVFDRVAVMIAFDLIELNGKDWAAAPLEERKLRLAQLLRLSTDIQYNGHFDCDGATLFKHACKLKLEAIVSKRRDYRYRPGPSKAWLKIKNPRPPAMLRMVENA